MTSFEAYCIGSFGRQLPEALTLYEAIFLCAVCRTPFIGAVPPVLGLCGTIPEHTITTTAKD